MRRVLCVIGLVALSVAQPLTVSYSNFEQVVVAGTAIGLTTAVITPPGLPMATGAKCRCRTAQLSFTINGTTPTASVGTLLEVGDILEMSGHDSLVLFRAIRTTGTSGQIDCTVWTP